MKAHQRATTVPVLSCGNIPLNNLTFPMGMLLYHITEHHTEAVPRKLPILANRLKRSVVSAVQSFDQAMVIRALMRVDKMLGEAEIPPKLAACVKEILTSEYCADSVLNLPSYSDQSVVLNSKLWNRLFTEPEKIPALVYLEMEKIVSILLHSDLENTESLAWRVMFDRELRERILNELDGNKVCWSRQSLWRRLNAFRSNESIQETSSGCGTLFFWGVDDAARKVPLLIETVGTGEERLRGVDDRGNLWDLPFTPRSVIAELRNGKLLPSLFTCYQTVALARNVVCVGGYYQASYLPTMQQGILRAVHNIPAYRTMGEMVRQVPTDVYLSGMQTVMSEAMSGHLIPAGPLEIIAGGGLDSDDIEKILSLTVRDAHIASLLETILDVAPWEVSGQDWKLSLAQECYEQLGARLVIK
jgi:hypothetical protein